MTADILPSVRLGGATCNMATKTKPTICLAGISANVNEFTTAHAACVKYRRTSLI
jgi:hypothetical protein